MRCVALFAGNDSLFVCSALAIAGLDDAWEAATAPKTAPLAAATTALFLPYPAALRESAKAAAPKMRSSGRDGCLPSTTRRSDRAPQDPYGGGPLHGLRKCRTFLLRRFAAGVAYDDRAAIFGVQVHQLVRATLRNQCREHS